MDGVNAAVGAGGVVGMCGDGRYRAWLASFEVGPAAGFGTRREAEARLEAARTGVCGCGANEKQHGQNVLLFVQGCSCPIKQTLKH